MPEKGRHKDACERRQLIPLTFFGVYIRDVEISLGGGRDVFGLRDDISFHTYTL